MTLVTAADNELVQAIILVWLHFLRLIARIAKAAVAVTRKEHCLQNATQRLGTEMENSFVAYCARLARLYAAALLCGKRAAPSAAQRTALSPRLPECARSRCTSAGQRARAGGRPAARLDQALRSRPPAQRLCHRRLHRHCPSRCELAFVAAVR